MSKHNDIQNKIFDSVGLTEQLKNWKLQGKKIVFTNGCFDLLHLGHIDYLSKAADLGNVLVLGLNTDASVSNLKGLHRPIQDEKSRLMVMASLSFVDAVILFDEPTPLELINLVQPDVLVKGSDYVIEQIVGYEVVKANGGEIKTIDYLPGYSTTAIEKKIKNA